MNPRRKFLLSVLSIPAWSQAPSSGGFKPAPASAYPSRQSFSKVTMAAVKYESDEETKPPFGKVNPNEYGVLPVLFVIQNDGDETLLLKDMVVYLQFSDRTRIEPTPASDLPYLRPPKRPGTGPGISPLPLPNIKKKNPLAEINFDARAFVAKTVLKGESAYGFFYFQTRYRRNTILYVNGIWQGAKQLFYAEIPLDSPVAATS